jgi:hypothetical protein
MSMIECRTWGHDFPGVAPSVFVPEARAWFDSLVSPHICVCRRCGVIRTDFPGGTRLYELPPADTV